MPVKLTENRVRSLPHREKAYAVRDAALAGFFVDVNKTSKSYKLQADLWKGTRGQRSRVRVIRHTLGRVETLPLDEARSKAAALIAQIKAGVDPFESTVSEPPKRSVTVAAAYAAYTTRDVLTVKAANKRELAPRTVVDIERCLEYLAPWKALPIASITRVMACELFDSISRNSGKVSANLALRTFRAVFNAVHAGPLGPLGENPVIAVSFHEEKRRDRCIEDLPGWYARLGQVPNPMRRLMHELALFSGLRPGTLVSLQKAWVRVDEKVIVIPAAHMKARREFALPLSAHMVGLLKAITELGTILEPSSVYCFPTRDAKNQLTHVQVWGEKRLGKETGHTIRHTYSNMAVLAGVSGDDRQLLLGQSVPGVRGTYLHAPALWSRLLEQQERVSAYLLEEVAQ